MLAGLFLYLDSTMRLSTILPKLAQWGRVALITGGTFLLAGCKLNFWQMDGHQTTMQTAGPVAEAQLQVFYITCWVTLIIFVLVGAVLAYATVKFKARNTADEHAEPPEQSHGNPLIELSLIGLSVLALVFITVPTLKAIWYTYDVPEEQKATAYEVTATGNQWWFKFDYPSEQVDGIGMLSTANELVIPAGRPVRVNLRTSDVIHSFWVPKLAGKVDMIPNRGNHLWLQADEPGYFWGQCAEYCGESHAVMRFRVIALNKEDFAAWVAHEQSPARTVAVDGSASSEIPKVKFASFRRNEYGYTAKWDAHADVSPLDNWKQQQFPVKDENPQLIAQGRRVFQEKTCIICHTVTGHEGIGTNGPNLTHMGSRTTIAGGLLENNADQLARWLTHPDVVKPGNKMYFGINGMAGYVKPSGQDWESNITLSDDDVSALVAYLQSLK